METHVTTTVSPAHQPSHLTENENKNPRIKSPQRASVLKRRSTKATFGNENKEPSHVKAVSFLEPNININTIENKIVASTPNNPKLDVAVADTFSLPREHNTTSKPNESPFTAFCKGLHLSPGPNMPCISPNVYGKNGGLFGSEAGNFISPSPMGLNLGPENGSSSPLFPRKHITKLDFSNRFIMFKSNRDEISIEHDDSHDKFGDQQLEPSLTYDENLPSSPKFSFPLKRSIYANKSLIPTHSRSTDIYSQSPLGPEPLEDTEEQQEEPQQPQLTRPNEEVEVEVVPVRKLVKSPSPPRKMTMDVISTQPKGREVQRSYSFGMASELNGQYGSVKKMRGEDEEDEEADYEGSNGSQSLSGSKKKVCCNCKKSRCLKLYCDCFARGKGCTKECNCQNCLNNDANAEERKAAMQNTLERNPIAFKPKVNLTDAPEIIEVKDTHARHIKGCNCKKSGCLKKYCECYQAGAKCTDMCKCENCKNCGHSTHRKGSQSYGIYASASLENHEGTRMRLESPASEMLYSAKSNARTFNFLEGEEGEDSLYEDEKEDGEDVKKFSHARKQIFSTQKVPFIVQNDHGKSSTNTKDDDHSDEYNGEKLDREKPKNSSKKKERLRKKSATITGHPKTPTSMTDSQKKNLENTPSPEKQSSVSGGRARRNVRPYGRINPDEYELGK